MIAQTKVVHDGLTDNQQGRLSDLEYYCDFDAPPMIPTGFKKKPIEHLLGGNRVKVERRGDDLYVGGKKHILFLDKCQENGKTPDGHLLCKSLENVACLNANLLDFLLKYPELIPDVWKKNENGGARYIYFWRTILRNSERSACVRYLYWFCGEWLWNYSWLSDPFDGSCVALICPDGPTVP